jgi:hypothetical protein
VLDQLLGTPMQEPDMRIDTLHDLSVELQHKAQHAVRRRMLRPEIDREVADGGFSHFEIYSLALAFSSPGSR